VATHVNGTMTGARDVEPGLAAANERLLVRLGYDLHDGPLQQVYALAQDVRLLRDQMCMLVGSEHHDRSSAVSPTSSRSSPSSTRTCETGALARAAVAASAAAARRSQAGAHGLGPRTEISTSIVVDGTFDTLSASQRIALLRVLQEALSNIKQHSGSRTVSVTLREDAVEGVRMEVRTTAAASTRRPLSRRRRPEWYRPRRHAGATPAARWTTRDREQPGGPTIVQGEAATLVSSVPQA
jgi:hypothetical protein